MNRQKNVRREKHSKEYKEYKGVTSDPKSKQDKVKATNLKKDCQKF